MTPAAPPEFLRFTAPDPAALPGRIAALRQQLAAAADPLARLDAAADLGGLLTTARQEAEARELLAAHVPLAQSLSLHEQAAWFWNAYATALQYGGEREAAEPHFATAVSLAQASGWRRIHAMTLHHWGRSLAEQQRFDQAQACIAQALAIRVEMGDAMQASSRRALAELAVLQQTSSRAS